MTQAGAAGPSTSQTGAVDACAGCPSVCAQCSPEKRLQATEPGEPGAATPQNPCPTSERLARFRQQGRVQAGSVIVSVFGDSVLPRGGRIWLGSLSGLLAPLGINDRLVRTSVFRLVQDDWLEAVAVGRRSDYRLSPAGRRRFAEAARQIYAPALPPWDQRWRLVTLTGPLEPDVRDRLRRALFWHGFGELGSSCFVHPSADLNAVFDALDAEGLGDSLLHLLPLVAANPHLPVSGSDAGLVRTAWNLGDLGADYAEFVASYKPVLRQWQRGGGPPAAMGDDCAFLIRTLLIHDYRRLLLRDPQLPGVLLPADWAGHEARALCRQLYQQLLAPSERHLNRSLTLADGEVPTASALLTERFGLGDPLRLWG